MKTRRIEIILGISLLIVIGVAMYQHKLIEEQYVVISNNEVIYLDTNDRSHINHDNIVYWLNTFNVKHVDIVSRQAILECGHIYESNAVREHNNLFGFSLQKGYMHFDHWIESIVYYKQWQNRKYDENKYANYYLFLEDVGYAEDTMYIQKLRNIKPKFTKNGNRSNN